MGDSISYPPNKPKQLLTTCTAFINQKTANEFEGYASTFFIGTKQYSFVGV